MPAYAATRVADLLNRAGLPVFGTKVLGVGIAYKPDVADDRESASIEVLRELERRGAEIAVLDPVVGSTRIAEHGFKPVAPDDDLAGHAIAVLLTDHEVLDLKKLATEVPIVLDTRGAYRRTGLQLENVETL
jgi:UDP-N-acetyl-D-glucosamine dehydrogenase